MTIRFFPATKGQKSSLLAKFLSRYQVTHELVSPEDRASRKTYRHGEVPAVEIDGRLFVDPNHDVLKKILQIES